MVNTNDFGQPVGDDLPGWTPPSLPDADVLTGRFAILERLDPARHVDDLYAAYAEAPDGSDWTYLAVGPFETIDEYRQWVVDQAAQQDPRHYAVVDAESGRALGTLALARPDTAHGVVEVGWVLYSPALQQTPIATEAFFLLMDYVFTLGYRRCEWRCDSHNARSAKAARRLGFSYEGTFRQAIVYKGRNRDTSWFSIIDGEWPTIRAAFVRWLDPSNFDANGRQRESLCAASAFDSATT